MMTQNPQEAQLKEVVEKLERSLLTPVISGELVSWVTTVQDGADELDEQIRPFLEVLHAEYKQIVKADSELMSRVEQLVAEEKKMLLALEAFRCDLHQLAERAPTVFSDEAKVADERKKVEKQGTDILIQIKRQQTAVATWLSEADYRDRGPVD
ncbi:hypothetical protein ETAA8_69740 [Anatilimnocola aggregata]|uniref:Uncharacterized protein n=1 Tax=Anatilimnocola aggregata TaxID=2528021 RepID=A0A517YNL0_9BACT|nr:hypothetical protein [Anatilimnocola aggregata]QDU31814.1 hypothetical protein ETAA8_69740 [Anatilimnocola aggregata]